MANSTSCSSKAQPGVDVEESDEAAQLFDAQVGQVRDNAAEQLAGGRAGHAKQQPMLPDPALRATPESYQNHTETMHAGLQAVLCCRQSVDALYQWSVLFKTMSRVYDRSLFF